MKTKDELKEKRKLAILIVIWEIPQLVAALLAALANRSAVLWMEFIETLSILFPALLLTAIFTYLRKNLHFRFNYGTGKIEALTALTCQIFDIIGLFLIILLGIRNLIRPVQEHHYYGFAIAMECVGLAISLAVLLQLRKLMKIRSGKISETFYLSLEKEFLFGIVSLITLIVSYFEKDAFLSKYLSPIVCLILAAPFVFFVGRHILHSASDLLDQTLEEELQLKILKILSGFYDEYTALDDVRSRRSGERIFIDIRMKFDNERTFQEIYALSEKMEEQLRKEIGDCEVNIII